MLGVLSWWQLSPPSDPQLKQQQQIDSLLHEANKGSIANNDTEAINIYKQILSIDANNQTALQKINELQQNKPPSQTAYKDLMDGASRAYDKGNYSQAKGLYKDALAQKPGDTAAKNGIENANQQLNKPKVPAGMVYVAGGSFTMGCTSEQGDDCDGDEEPHEVTLSDFYISKYEVTNAEYAEFLNAKGNQTEGGKTWLDIADEYCNIAKKGSRYVAKSGYENHPVIEVTWYGAAAYAKWKGGRLPTEAEWEYAARGGKKQKATKYAGSNNIATAAWYSGNSGATTHPVGSKQPNELGLYDMSGNVWEWCSDWYAKDYYSGSPLSNPKGAASGSRRVLRGGSWSNYPRGCRVAIRGINGPDDSGDDIGFRICL